MKTRAILLFVLVAAPIACAAEGHQMVKVFTLKDGEQIIAAHSITSTLNGTTTYNVTEPNGKKVSFDASQIVKVVDESLAQATNSEPYRGPNLGSSIATPRHISSSNSSADSPVIGLRKSSSVSATAMNTGMGMNTNMNTNTGMVIGMNPNVPANWNSSLSQAGGTFIPSNMSNSQGFGPALNNWDISLSQLPGATYISNNPNVPSFGPAVNSWDTRMSQLSGASFIPNNNPMTPGFAPRKIIGIRT